MVAPNDFYRKIGDGLMLLSSNLKQSLEEANGIAEPKPQGEETDVDQNHIQDDSPQKEN